MKKRSCPFWLILVLCLVGGAYRNIVRATPADEDFQIDSVYMNYQEPVLSAAGGVPINRYFILVYLSARKADLSTATTTDPDLSPSNVRIQFVKSGKVIPTAAIRDLIVRGRMGGRIIRIAIDYNYTGAGEDQVRPDPGDDEIQVEFTTLHFLTSTGAQKVVDSVEGTGKIYTADNRDELINNLTEGYKNAVAHAKTSDEKNAFVGLSVSVPTGSEGGDTEGNGDIAFNKLLYNPKLGTSTLFDKINLGFQLKKGSEEGADPRHLTVGLTFRKTFFFYGDEIRQLGAALRNPALADNPALPGTQDLQSDTVRRIRDLQDHFFNALLWDNAFRFEGDVKGTSIGNVSNLLWDSQLQIASVSQAFAGKSGFINFRWLPVGVEAGYNLTNNDDKDQEKHSLLRLKTGLTLTLAYSAPNEKQFLSRVEFETKAVTRYLFRRESAFDEDTKMALVTDKGNKYWIQSDLKFMFGNTTQFGRVGFRVNFNRGSLPPVYAFTKAFNVGIVLESTDDTTAEEVK